MTLKDFSPHETTGQRTNDFLFNRHVTGTKEARFELLQETHHTKGDVERAKDYLRRNFDAKNIKFIKEIKL